MRLPLARLDSGDYCTTKVSFVVRVNATEPEFSADRESKQVTSSSLTILA